MKEINISQVVHFYSEEDLELINEDEEDPQNSIGKSKLDVVMHF